MREIKYRAWVKNKKCIKNVIQLDFLNNQVLFDDLDFGKFDDVELMQYTGLHDKNGKEIYEGDILKYISCSKKTIFYTVKWADDYSGFSMENEDTFLLLPELSLFDSEVVGNIYETNLEELK